MDQYPDMLPVCHTRRTQSGDPILRSLAQAKKLLEEFCTSIPKVFIIVDGLDECEQIERKQALDILMEITSRCDASEPGKLRILFVSQEYADIRRALHSAAVSRMTPKTINISDADNEADIRTYTKSWVDEIAIKFKPFSADMQDYLRNLTIANAKGTIESILRRSKALLKIKACFYTPSSFYRISTHRQREKSYWIRLRKKIFQVDLKQRKSL